MSMSMVSAGGALSRFERPFGAASATDSANRTEKPQRIERRDDDDDDGRRARRSDDGPGRRNPLVGALMQALQALMPSGDSTPAANKSSPLSGSMAPVSSTPTNAPAAANKASQDRDRGSLKEAAVAFASELFSALRSVRGGDYGNLAQGLRDLARTIEPPAAPPAAPTPVPVAPTPVAFTPIASPPAAAAPAPLPVKPPPAPAPSLPALEPVAIPRGGTAVEINIAIQIRFTSAATFTNNPDATPAKKEESPLLAAFKRLMEQLNPQAGESGGTSDTSNANSPEARLKAFLLGVAQALEQRGAGRGAPAATLQAPVGGLLSVAA